MLLRESLHALLGGWPLPTEPDGYRLGIERGDGFVVERLRLAVTRPTAAFAVESLPALLVRPDGDGPWPAVLYCHAHGNTHELGCRELLDGRAAMSAGPWGPALARRGFVSLAIDLPCFGSRRLPTESALAKRLLWRGDTLMGMMLRELASALDYLLAREDCVLPARVATLGLSMGATHAWWLAALDERVRAVVDLCCLADLASLLDGDAHDLHGWYLMVPGLLARTTTAEIAALIAPRAHFCGIGMADPLTPPAAVERVVEALARRYAEAGAPHAFERFVEVDGGHVETASMRAAALAFLERRIGAA